MHETALTRRTLLGATAGLWLSGALGGRSAFAALAAPQAPVIREQPIGRLPAGVHLIPLSAPADMVALSWRGPSASLALRVPPPGGGGRGRWVAAAACAQAASSGRELPVLGTPLWTGPTSALQLRSACALSDVRLYLLDSGAPRAPLSAPALSSAVPPASMPLAQPALNAGPGQPPIIARKAWAGAGSPPSVAPEYGAVQLAIVHHTDNPNLYAPDQVPAMLRAIYAFHRFANGWDDIGYNFVVDLYGRIFEARAGGIHEPVVGAHAGGYNHASTGIAVLGTFNSEGPTSAAMQSLRRLLAWKLALHGLPAQGRTTVRVSAAGAAYSRYPAGKLVSLSHVSGHRDGDTTDCPGNVLYARLRELRASAAKLQGAVATATLSYSPGAAGGSGEAGAGSPPSAEDATGSAPQPIVLGGRVALSDGRALAGAALQLQERKIGRRGQVVSEQPLAQLRTAANGEWSLAARLQPAPQGSSLRVLCAGAGSGPVAVSAPLELPGVVRL